MTQFRALASYGSPLVVLYTQYSVSTCDRAHRPIHAPPPSAPCPSLIRHSSGHAPSLVYQVPAPHRSPPRRSHEGGAAPAPPVRDAIQPQTTVLRRDQSLGGLDPLALRTVAHPTHSCSFRGVRRARAPPKDHPHRTLSSPLSADGERRTTPAAAICPPAASDRDRASWHPHHAALALPHRATEFFDPLSTVASSDAPRRLGPPLL